MRLGLELRCSEVPFCVDFFSFVKKKLEILFALKKTGLLK